MGRFDRFLICSDIDGTFAFGKDVPQRNLDAVKYFQSEGGIFTLSSGRSPGYAEQTFPVVLNGPSINDNGAVIYDHRLRRVLWSFPLDGSGIMLEWVSRQEVQSAFLRFSDGTFEVEKSQIADFAASHTTGELHKVLCSFSDEDAAIAFRDHARETFGNRYDIRRSWSLGVEFISPLGGKGNGLKYLKTILGDKIHTAIAIGDYENDLSMIEAADRSFAPANACKDVLDAADTVLCHARDGAVGELIELLDREYEGGILR